MAPPLTDLRYPFGSAEEFIKGGFFADSQAFHLTIAWVGLLFLIFAAFFLPPKKTFSVTCATLAFVLMPYTNPAFSIRGLFPTDFFSVLTVISYFFSAFLFNKRSKSLPWHWLCFWSLIGIHSLWVFLYYNLGESSALSHRVVLILRPLISVIAGWILYGEIKEHLKVRSFLSLMVILSLGICAIVYILQMVKFAGGLVPFGTMPSAGFGGIRFGGVSNEGGHLAKLTLPLLMSILLWTNRRLRYPLFVFFSAVFLINVSATGYLSFFVLIFSVILLTLISILRRFTGRTLFVFVPVVFSVGLLAFLFNEKLNQIPAYAGLVGKVSDSINQAGSPEKDPYGRSPLIATAIINRFPLGVGFAGSTQRNMVMSQFSFVAKENNLGVNVAVASWSFFAVIIFLYLSYKFAASVWNTSIVQKSVLISLVFLMSIDVLWSSVGMFLMLLSAANPIRQLRPKSV